MAVGLVCGLTLAHAQAPRVSAGAISGRITDAAGDPLIAMAVTVRLAASPLQPIATSETDDRGEYRFGHLPSGQYIVSATSVPVVLTSNGIISLAAAASGGLAPKDSEAALQRQVYYPGVPSVAAAQPILLDSGENRTSVDFSTPSRPAIDAFGALTSKAAPTSPPSNLTALIRGQVLVDGRPCPQVTVRAVPDHDQPNLPTVPPAVMTDVDGRYEFRQLPPGIFRVIALKAGFLATEYRQLTPSRVGEAIELRSGESMERVDVTLLRPSVVTGHLTDQRGNPVERASIQLLQVRYRDGSRRLVDAGGLGTRRTDDRGVFRVYGLRPGEYLVSATVGQAVTYYPGTGDPGEAQRVRVDVGVEAAGLDLALMDAPTARITGTIVDAAGSPVPSGVILARTRRAGGLTADPVVARPSPDGRFEFTNVASGDYVIQALKRDTRNERSLYDEGESVSQAVSVAGTDVTGLSLRTTRGATVTGRISFEGDADPDLYSAVNISAIPVDFDRTPQNLGFPASAAIQPDLTLLLAGLTGARVLRLLDPPPGWVLKAVLLNGRDVTDTPVVFGAPGQSVGGLEVVLTRRASEIKGRALDARARSVTGARVVIFSTDRQQWTETSRFVALSAPTRGDGTFSVGSLPPGDYYAAAVTPIGQGEWRDPDLLEALIPDAVHVTISESETVSVAVRVVAR